MCKWPPVGNRASSEHRQELHQRKQPMRLHREVAIWRLDPVAWRERMDLPRECLSASVTSYVLNQGVGERKIVVHLTTGLG